MILESIVTTRNADEAPFPVNISPMGPRLLIPSDDSVPNIERFELRPFETSTTYANLKRTGVGVMHVDDNVALFASAAIGKLKVRPATHPATQIDGEIISSACRAYEFKVTSLDDSGPRMTLQCEVVCVHRMRDFFGFNRAKHAVIEAAILATRIGIIPDQEILSGFNSLRIMVEKTAGPQESQAFELLDTFVSDRIANIENSVHKNTTVDYDTIPIETKSISTEGANGA